MDEIDVVLFKAWSRVAARVRVDRMEALRRRARRGRAFLSRPIRPWCLCIRASDTRLSSYAGVPKYLPEEHRAHEIWVASETLSALCKPVHIPWPGIDYCHAAARLGRARGSVCAWMRKGVFQIRHQYCRTAGKLGKPVPFVWSNTALDPNFDMLRAPHEIWGTLWQYLWQRVPEGLEQTLTRVPDSRPDPRDGPGSRRFRGWQWVCPGLAAARDEETERPRDEGQPGGCGRVVDRLYLPLRVWTMADAMGEDPLGEDGGAADRRSSTSLACGDCHRVRSISMLDPDAWNRFVAHVSGGLLYGREVAKPRLRVERRRRYVKPRRRCEERLEARRERVMELLRAGLSRPRIAARLGVSISAIGDDVRALFRQHGVARTEHLTESAEGSGVERRAAA